ncbi:hypothetical protein D3C76_780800 [compost metagenome]
MYSGMMKIETRTTSLGLAVEGDLLVWEDVSVDISFRACDGIVVAAIVYGKLHRGMALAADCNFDLSGSDRQYTILQFPIRQSIEKNRKSSQSYAGVRGDNCGAKKFDDWLLDKFYVWPVYYHGSYSDLKRIKLCYFKSHFFRSIFTYNMINDDL